MDDHLSNNERFSILPGHKKFSPLAPPPPRRQVPGRAHLVVAGNKEKQRKARPCAVCNPLSPSPRSSSSGSSAHGAVGVLAPHLGLVLRNPHHIASRADRRRRCQDCFPLFPLVNSSFGNNENSAIARKCARAVRSRYNRVSLYYASRRKGVQHSTTTSRNDRIAQKESNQSKV